MKKKIEEVVLEDEKIKNARLAFYEELATVLGDKHNTSLQGLNLSKTIYNRRMKKKFLWIPHFYKSHLLPENIEEFLDSLVKCNNNAWHEVLHNIKDSDEIFLKLQELRREKYPASKTQVLM